MKKLLFLVMALVIGTAAATAQQDKNTGNKMLLIIDAQYDFINGSLAVTGADKKMDALAEWMNTLPQGEYKQIVMTSDFHPYNHSSFKDNGGLWPVHCVQYTHGAAIWQPVADAAHRLQVDAPVLIKGDNIAVDEYSIMKSPVNGPRLLMLLAENEIDEIDVCGLCGDFCVGNSIKDLVAAGFGKKIVVMKQFIGNIDDGTVLNGIIKDNNLKVY